MITRIVGEDGVIWYQITFRDGEIVRIVRATDLAQIARLYVDRIVGIEE